MCFQSAAGTNVHMTKFLFAVINSERFVSQPSVCTSENTSHPPIRGSESPEASEITTITVQRGSRDTPEPPRVDTTTELSTDNNVFSENEQLHLPTITETLTDVFNSRVHCSRGKHRKHVNTLFGFGAFHASVSGIKAHLLRVFHCCLMD